MIRDDMVWRQLVIWLIVMQIVAFLEPICIITLLEGNKIMMSDTTQNQTDLEVCSEPIPGT